MDISVPEELSQPVLTVEAIRKTLPYVCLKDDGSSKSKGSIKNILAGFNQMLKVGLLDESRLALQMESEFQLTLQCVREHAKLHKKTQWPSFLNDVRAAANEIINFDTSNMTFSQTLTVLAGKYFGVSISKTTLSKLLTQLEPSVSKGTYYSWMTGQSVPKYQRTVDSVLSLDIKLNANGSLKNKVKKSFIIHSEKENISSTLTKTAFILPSLLEQEMNEYIDFRVNDTKPKNMSYLKNETPSSKIEKRKIRQLKSINNVEWAEGTASYFKDQIIFLAKYIKEEHPEEFQSISLTTFFNHDLVEGLEKYIIQKGTISFGLRLINWLKSECAKNRYVSNYLYSMDEFTSNIDDWIEELELLNIDFKQMTKRLEKHYDILEGSRNVEWILEKSEPLKYVNKISEGLWHEANYSAIPISPTASAIIFDMLIPCPIRGKNLSDLEWLGKLSSSEIRNLHKTETCALYFDTNKQCYTIFVHKEKLKNRKSTTIKSIIQPLPHLFDKFEQYLSVRKKHLDSKGWVTNILFPLMKIAANIIDFKLDSGGIGNLLSKATKSVINTHFPEENISHGINPHGMRHLSASLFLRDNPENYTGLATLLMDNLETVTRIYAKRDDVGNHEKIANWAESLMELPNAA